MAKYHISEDGNPRACRAKPGNCRFGEDNAHYSTKEEARAAYEASQTPTLSRTTTTVGDPVAFQNFRGEEAVGKLVSVRSKRGVIREDRSGYHYRVKLTADGWVDSPTGSTRDSRVMNPGNYPVPTFADVQKGIAVPPGFTAQASREEIWYGGGDHDILRLTGPDGVEVKIVYYGDPNGGSYDVATGHVTFDSDKGRRSFDRHGVSDSFYIRNPERDYNDNAPDPITQANEAIKDFIEVKIPEARARIAGSEKLPGSSFLVTPQQKEKLRATGGLTLTPSGFGTGYHFTTTHPSVTASRGARPASEEQKRFFGLDELWVESFDAD